MDARRDRKGIVLLILLLACGFALPAWMSYRPEPRKPDRDNLRWIAALDAFSGRYEGLSGDQKRHVRDLEQQYRILMDALTAVDGMGGDHGRYHRTKPDTEAELWTLLQGLPEYPATTRMLMAALDDVYLGYHRNGWWGPWWHWPYLDCTKATAIADRLAAAHPELEEEALWTKIYCFRISDDTHREPRSATWKQDARVVRALGDAYLKKHPSGKYSARVTAMLAGENVLLELPGWPVMGRTPSGLGGYAHTEVAYRGPEFLMDRSDP